MYDAFRIVLSIVISPIILPHILCVLIQSRSRRRLIISDIERWSFLKKSPFNNRWLNFLLLLVWLPEYRSLLRAHLGYIGHILYFPRPKTNLYIWCHSIGEGLFIEHGFSTVIAAKSIGRNCWINQQVTIGDSGKGIPIIGNNVHICAGAIVVGPIHIGDNATIGAGAIVVEDVPSDSLVISEKAHQYR